MLLLYCTIMSNIWPIFCTINNGSCKRLPPYHVVGCIDIITSTSSQSQKTTVALFVYAWVNMDAYPQHMLKLKRCFMLALSSISCVIWQGVLIVGERGTGKTSLALAIAAEAKVPLVEVKAQQLEAGLWVGQSASNVRELFQTARDLVSLVSLCIASPNNFQYLVMVSICNFLPLF